MKNSLKILITLIFIMLVGQIHAGITLANYQSVVTNQSPSSYFTFDNGSLTSVAGTSVTLSTSSAAVANQLSYDVFGNPSNCVFMTLQGDVFYDPNESSDLLINGGGSGINNVPPNNSQKSGSITCLFRSTDPGPPSGSTTSPGQKFIFSAGGDASNSNQFSLFFENLNATNNPGALKLAFGDSTTTILPLTNVTYDEWYYFAVTYNENITNASGQPNTNKAKWYLGRLNGAGILTNGTTVNVTNAVAGDATDFFIGAQTNSKSELCKPGDGRIDEFAIWSRQLSAAEIQAQFTNLPNAALPPVSNYQTVISNQSPSHYFQLAGNTVDSLHPSTVVLATNIGTILVTNAPFNSSVGYCPDYFNDQNGAAYFSIATDAIYTNVNLLNGGGTYTGSHGTGQGTISGMFHGFSSTNYYTGQHYIFDAGGSTATSNAFGIYMEAPINANPWSVKVHFGDSATVMVPATNMLSEWYYFAVTYDETVSTNQVHWWVGQPGISLQSGTLSATNGSLAGSASAFYIGNQAGSSTGGFRFQQSSHTDNGQISQIAVWNRLLASSEVTNQFNALSVSAGPPPVLNIVASGTNAIISWPSSTDPSYGLQSTTNLILTNWLGAGSPSTVGASFVVTNSISSSAKFYRLTK